MVLTVCILVFLQYDGEMPPYGTSGMEHLYQQAAGDPHATHRSIPTLSHSPTGGYTGHSPTGGMGSAAAHGQYPYSSTAASTSMAGVMNASPGDSQLKRDKDAVYG